MKNFLIYLAGLVSGVILTFIVALVINSSTTPSNDGLTMFEERGEMMQEKSFKIFQSLDANHALAMGKDEDSYSDLYFGITVMIIGDEDTHFYDDQIINTSSTKRFYQVGTYKYQTKSENWKTVPVIMLLDKK